MHKIFCDFCNKEIKPLDRYITVTTSEYVPIGYHSSEEEKHFHSNCAERLKNKVTQFIAEANKEGDAE